MTIIGWVWITFGAIWTASADDTKDAIFGMTYAVMGAIFVAADHIKPDKPR